MENFKLVFTLRQFKMPFKEWNTAKPSPRIKGPSYRLIFPNLTRRMMMITGEMVERMDRLVVMGQEVALVAVLSAKRKMATMLHEAKVKAEGRDPEEEGQGRNPNDEREPS
jgi:hypothetical protein